TNSMDEALALPSAEAVTIALRTQQVIAHESGVTNTVDPLGGSYFVEALTDRMEREANGIFKQIEDLGGVLPAIQAGYFQQAIADAAAIYQREIDSHARTIVGVNDYVVDEPIAIPILEMDPQGLERQLARLERLRRERDNGAVKRALDRLEQACLDHENTMPAILEAVRAYATLGEMMGVMRRVFGEYTEPIIV
ncbi:MAG: methylmalonyl-CoA mutase, partial [Chloroflexi bacterium]|nr:methylmalonyl-CoA mutase [Chloroflexota bacterium]